MFAKNIGLSLLPKSDTWFSDGHFGLPLEFFKQLYVICVQTKVYVTAVHCILERKTQVTYEESFNIIINECKTCDMYPSLKILTLGF